MHTRDVIVLLSHRNCYDSCQEGIGHVLFNRIGHLVIEEVKLVFVNAKTAII